MKDEIYNIITAQYFKWLCSIVHTEGVSFEKLLSFLKHKEFKWITDRDRNRAKDGIALRYRFARTVRKDESANLTMRVLKGPCSILEMMVALALRCEETIMDNPAYGNRTSQWFWSMVTSLGLGGMHDDNFDEKEADRIIRRFIHKEYEPNGKGGLFYIRNTEEDLREMEIWAQMCRYLDNYI